MFHLQQTGRQAAAGLSCNKSALEVASQMARENAKSLAVLLADSKFEDESKWWTSRIDTAVHFPYVQSWVRYCSLKIKFEENGRKDY